MKNSGSESKYLSYAKYISKSTFPLMKNIFLEHRTYQTDWIFGFGNVNDIVMFPHRE